MAAQELEKFEDSVRLEKVLSERENQYSPYCDLIYYPSSRDPDLTLAMRIRKPAKPSYIVVDTHGWHMSIPKFKPQDTPQTEYLSIDVDMRGRAFSDGKADCNGWELFDIIDACEYVKKHYREYLIDPDVVYYEGGSGGGGNGYAVLAKFPDYFAAATVMCGPSDYALWYDHDPIGEFRDEMDVWIAPRGEKKAFDEAYASRSGLHGVQNLQTPLLIVHGNTDERVPVEQARVYMDEVRRLGKESLVRYWEMENVGTRQHWGNATEEMLRHMEELSEENRRAHRVPLQIPKKGKMAVLGYLVTKDFSVFCESIDRVGEIEYDLAREEFRFTGSGAYTVIRHK